MKNQIDIDIALHFIKLYGNIGGGPQKQWVLDQVVRVLANDYEQWVKDHNAGENGPDTYYWEKGIVPQED